MRERSTVPHPGDAPLPSTRRRGGEALLEAGVEAVAARGLDRVTASDVTSIAGHARQTFYTYFGDTQGMLADIWLAYGADWLSGLTTTRADGTDQDLVLLDILAAARRIPDVVEVLQPDVAMWWRDQAYRSESQQLRVLWHLATTLGAQMSRPVTPEIEHVNALLPIIDSLPGELDDSPLLLGLDPIEARTPLRSELVPAESTDAQLIQAAIEVIARSGVAAASMNRVARRAHVSTGAVYPRFKSINELIDESFAQAIREVVRGNLATDIPGASPADKYGLVIIASMEPARATWRHYRTEMHLEARINPELAAKMRPGFIETNRMLEGAMITSGLTPAVSARLALLTQALGVGFSILNDIGLPVADLDHRIMARHISAVAASSQ